MRGLSDLIAGGPEPGPVARQVAGQLSLLRSDERGATLALVALLLVVMLGMTAMVVDLGAMRVVRRGLIPAADAAALAAAQDLVERPWDTSGACATAQAYVLANAPDATMTVCDVDTSGGVGVVIVEVSEAIDSSFVAPPTEGFEPAGASSAAAFGEPSSIADLRPIGLCYDGWPALRQLIDNPPSSIVYLELPFPKSDPLACGGLSFIGNFASLDFESGTGITTIEDWVRNGYPESFALDGPNSLGCTVGVPCVERPYAMPAIAGAMWSLVNSGRYVPFPVYDYADADEVHLMGVVRARLYGFDMEGPLDQWELRFKIKPGLLSGTCCGSPAVAGGSRVVAICGVDGVLGPVCQNGGNP